MNEAEQWEFTPQFSQDIGRQLFLDSAPAMIQSIDSSGRILHVSDLWLTTLGYDRAEVIGAYFANLLSTASKDFAVSQGIPNLFSAGVGSREYEILRKDGTIIDVLLSAIVLPATNDTPPHSLTILHDISESKQLRLKLLEQHQELQVTLHSICNGVVATDCEGRIKYVNPVATILTGWSDEAAKGLPVDDVVRMINVESRRRVQSSASKCLAENRAVAMPEAAVLIARNCNETIIRESASPMHDASGELIGCVQVFYDVTEQYRLNAELRYRACRDPLTDLLNRSEFSNALEQLVASSGPTDTASAVMYLDLDQFKVVNDSVGHEAGDKLLKQIAGILLRYTRRGDVVARLGGDEFGLVLSACSPESAKRWAERICTAIGDYRFQHGSQRFRVGASIGFVLVNEHWPSAASLLRAAESACYAAKAAGRNRVHAYAHTDRAIELHQADVRWIQRIQNALDANRFELFWQEIRALDPKDTSVHCEILIRMIEENGDLTLPGAFLPTAERHQIISRVDRWVIKTILDWMAGHARELDHVSTISINLSGLSLGDAVFHRDIVALFERMSFDGSKLCFEVTETAAITNLHEAIAFFESMSRYGVRFALDDFGSGVSSFGYLKTLPVNYLKIDGQFVRNLHEDKVDQATVRCIQDIARITGKETIAECVDSEQVETMLRELGVNYTQGFLRHRPESLQGLLNNRASSCLPAH
ncbi:MULTISPECIES: EAL domain-containing protein [unclassified Paraburkholderia]|uniref:EAL domain-containing protein n=1 Tax=unclassified Paraburkholderia TaxID=2615204 RepID=UPI0016094483|nr:MULTISPECIES: EAL domain-containing protein [unclassified Paraburkholderia]MBB5447784.1 diguanylate cyclase (GGDEF)-like protein/PAS domain S-box-containing protein [Paraburkholderia sp. WSM4177]MBB5488279.1 diguanylate cyclase (GGDEF)-like protein/PAS domain S-box-containing protein [Paraburkholderia sp. WSM4180]